MIYTHPNLYKSVIVVQYDNILDVKETELWKYESNMKKSFILDSASYFMSIKPVSMGMNFANTKATLLFPSFLYVC